MRPDRESSGDGDLDLAGVEVDRDVVAVQQVRARAFGKLFGEELPPPKIGRFQVLREVGHGGMGVVYAAFDPQLERNVALKVLRRRGHGRDDRGQARLLREARAAARLSHPNVVTVYEVGEDAGAIHIAMELLDAVTLRSAAARMGDDWRAIVTAYLAAGRGLLAAHEAGIVHRDFKPDNVLVATDGRVCVTDFGLALAEVGTSDGDAASTEVTQGVVGTVPYMAPEQLRGEPATALADQFGYCVALWEALHGRRPFEGATAAELVAAIERGEIDGSARPIARGVPAALRELCRRGLAADPHRRYPSLAPLLTGLERLVAPRRAWWIPTIAVGAAVGVGVLALRDDGQTCTGAATQLAPVWGPARRDALREAVEATALPYAVDVARELDAQLERYAQTWSAAHREACLATRVRAEASEQALDRAMACLTDRLERFDATLGVLERVDAAMVESALAVSAALPSISRCGAAEVRASLVTLPEDAEARAQVQRQLAALEAGAALRRAGRPRDSAVALAAVAEASLTLGHAPLEALVRVEQAETALALAEFSEATHGLDVALELAGSARELDVVAHAAVAQAAAVVQQGDAAAARGVIRAARIAVATAGDP
ncbi:MAG: serine/threonine protein kinase, partial [Myxococcales bacterium]|nr:serine/threonine protein kinase [Myxococcales bacterium]